MSEITFHFGEQVFSAGKASKEAYSALYNFFDNVVSAENMPPKWKDISDTILTEFFNPFSIPAYYKQPMRAAPPGLVSKDN